MSTRTAGLTADFGAAHRFTGVLIAAMTRGRPVSGRHDGCGLARARGPGWLTAVGLILVTAVALTPTGPARAGAPTAAGVVVPIQNFAFHPGRLTVSAGAKVTFTNRDAAPHDATATGGPERFGSPTLSDGKSWSHTFTTAGTYSYICSIHPYMKAVLVVAPSTGDRAAVPATTGGVPRAATGQATPAMGEPQAMAPAGGERPWYPLAIVVMIVTGAVAISFITTTAGRRRAATP
jgi:plastocyanin